MKKLPPGYILSSYPDEGGVRYDIHYQGKNIAYAYIKPGEQANELWLDGLHVLPRFQDKGLGTYLMNAVEKDAKGKTIILRARPYKSRNLNTKELVSFYIRLGYKLIDKENRMMKKIKK